MVGMREGTGVHRNEGRLRRSCWAAWLHHEGQKEKATRVSSAGGRQPEKVDLEPVM
jgi:hypothetical protein